LGVYSLSQQLLLSQPTTRDDNLHQPSDPILRIPAHPDFVADSHLAEPKREPGKAEQETQAMT
jgi:hypothetical protein